MFFYINIRIFKIKLNSYISFAIASLNSLKYKQIKIYYSVLNFEYCFYKFLLFFVFTYLFLILI